MYQKRVFRWFTLVELIVVITIVGILSTIGFVSYSSYITGARDSSRLGQLANITEAMRVFSANRALPIPDNKIDILANTEIVAFQWNAWVDVLDTLDYNNGGRDPSDKGFFTYVTTKKRDSMQMLGFMEETWSLQSSFSSIVPTVSAVNFEERFPKTYGNKIGALLSVDVARFNTPLHAISWVSSVDLVNTQDEYVSYLSDTEQVEGDGTELTKSNPNHSCKRLKESGQGSRSGIYIINPNGAWDIQVYCDMETRWWGWTLIARSVKNGTGTFAWGTDTGLVSKLSEPYVMWSVTDISYEEFMIASYRVKRIIDELNITSWSSTNSLSDGIHVLWVNGISWGSITGQGMFFVR